MEYRKLGDSGLNVSVICLGTMTFGEQNTEQEAHEQLDYALDQGVNFIDTAELYAVPSRKGNSGLTEQYIGSWLKGRSDRDKIILATKVTGPSQNLKYISENLGFSRPRILEAVDKSLRQLQTDYIDLYQLHWPERNTNMFGKRGFKYDPDDQWEDNFEEVVATLNQLIQEGKIRHWGLSNETPWGIMRSQAAATKLNLKGVVSIQNPYSLLNRTYEVGNAEVSLREGIGLLAYSPMAFGLLSGKYHKKEEREGARLHRYKQMSRYNSPVSYKATGEYLSIAQRHGLSLATMALAFVNQQAFLTSNIIGATSMQQLKENIASIDVTLSAEILSEIEEVHEAMPNPAP